MRTLSWFACLGLFLHGMASESLAQRPGGGPGGGFLRALPLMIALDADEDGEISDAEIKNASAALTKLDKNKDGKLDGEELRPNAPPRGPGGPGGPGGRPPRGEGKDQGPPPPDGAPGAGAGPGRGPGRGFGGPPNPQGFVDRLFEFDADKDGKLTREELAKMAEQFGGGRRRGEDGGASQRPQRPD